MTQFTSPRIPKSQPPNYSPQIPDPAPNSNSPKSHWHPPNSRPQTAASSPKLRPPNPSFTPKSQFSPQIGNERHQNWVGTVGWGQLPPQLLGPGPLSVTQPRDPKIPFPAKKTPQIPLKTPQNLPLHAPTPLQTPRADSLPSQHRFGAESRGFRSLRGYGDAIPGFTAAVPSGSAPGLSGRRMLRAAP